MMYEEYGWGSMMGFGVLGMFIWFGFWVAFIWFILYLFRHGKGSSKNNSALQILEGRHAKGEINKEEFEEKRKTLMR